DLPMAKIAKNFTLCDHFFHAAFGGSFLNHQWLIAARSPEYLGGTPEAGIDDPNALKFGANQGPYYYRTADANWYPVNTAFTGTSPPPYFPDSTPLVLNQTNDTIGDRLTD